jgi:hypothetical protein
MNQTAGAAPEYNSAFSALSSLADTALEMETRSPLRPEPQAAPAPPKKKFIFVNHGLPKPKPEPRRRQVAVAGVPGSCTLLGMSES